MAWRNAMWLYPWDAADEGVGRVVEEIQTRAGLNGVNVALAYHSGLFLLPHNPRRKLFFPQPGLYFRPDAARFAGLKIAPHLDELAGTGLVEGLRAETGRRGMQLTAWVVGMHNSGLGFAYPEVASVNAFGDRHYGHLCPANPDLRAYITALIQDLAAREFDGVLVESLDYQWGMHGYHHEVFGLPMTPLASYLFGLCFCPHCVAAARARGVDVKRVQQFARSEVEAFFDGQLEAGREGISWPEVQSLAGGELGAFHRARVEVVTSLYEEIRAGWPRAATRLEALDFSPLRPWVGDASGQPGGVSLDRLRGRLDAVHPCPYFPTPEANAPAMRAYRATVPADLPIIPAMRAIPPQVVKPEDLVAHMQVSEPAQSAGYTFYNYGFMRRGTMDWIRQALAAIQTEARA